MKQQHHACRCEPTYIGAMGGGGRQRHAGGAHQTGKPNQQAERTRHHELRSSSSRAIAARSSAMPVPEREEVASTFGKAAGCFASTASVSAMQLASSEAFTWSALVSTI